jgi:hypothetical protein
MTYLLTLAGVFTFLVLAPASAFLAVALPGGLISTGVILKLRGY